ncbi:hypothetical protein CAPTEDRAFT_79458, partial [Capitella teleta]
TTLKLHSNELEEIPALLISSLEHLDLKYNKIGTINIGAFDALVNLKTLDLWGNDTINDGAFAALVNLKTLNLRGNELDKIPVLSISTLEELNLEHNKISTINDGAFEALVNLKTLDLSWTELEEIPVFAFEALVNLKSLNLQGNPFKCDC